MNTIEIKKIWYKLLENLEANDLPRERVVAIFEEEVQKIINKNIDPDAVIQFVLDDENKEISIFNTNGLVVENDDDVADTPSGQISFIHLKDAKKIDKKAAIDDVVSIEIHMENFLQSPSQKVKDTLKVINSSIRQGIALLKKSIVFENYQNRVGQEVLVKFTSKNANGSWNVEIAEDGTNAYLPVDQISSKRNVNPGNIAKVVIQSVIKETKGSQIQVSLDSPDVVKHLIKDEVPEVSGNLIEIVDVVRQPGFRSKVAVRKNPEVASDLDASGAIIGPNGTRINAICQQLDGESIDIINWDENIKEYIKNSLSPANVIDVVLKENRINSYYVVVPDDGVTLAIGRGASNVSLATKLTKQNLDIISVSDAEKNKLVFDKTLVNTFLNDNKRKRVKSKHNYKTPLGNPNFNLEDFDSELQNFQKENELNSFGLDEMNFNEIFEQYRQKEVDNAEDNIEEQNNSVVEKSSEELTKEDYRKAKEVAKSFKEDKDLTSFGLDVDFDLSDFEDEDWD